MNNEKRYKGCDPAIYLMPLLKRLNLISFGFTQEREEGE